MNYEKIDRNSVSEGRGVRVVLWVSGCSMQCKNCHNPQTRDFNSGIPFTSDTMQEILDYLDKPYISGLTISGGHPLEGQNIGDVKVIVKTVKEIFPDKTIWLYTGHTWEDISIIVKGTENPWKYSFIPAQHDYDLAEILYSTDVIVDGRYIDELRDITLPFRGSSNQRIIDVQQSLKTGEVVLYG